MLQRSDFLALNFYKKEKFTGSYEGMRFRVEKEEDSLLATIWPEPFAYAATPDEKKESEHFPFSEEGLCQVTDWLNRKHEENIDLFRNAPFWGVRE